MEDVLEVYHRPYTPRHPVICLDETAKELHGTPRGTLPAVPGVGRRDDYEYERLGTRNLFLWVEPLAGKRHVQVTQRRTAVDFADQLRQLVDEAYPEADCLVLVTDNLNTHTIAALYERFPPAEARRIAQKLEWHYTPEHASWLNMAEIELSVLSSQCINRRIGTEDELKAQVAAWATARNTLRSKIDWQFTTDDARIKLKRLYPTLVQY